MKSYRFQGKHPGELADGRSLAPGQEVVLKATEEREPHNQRLIDEGQLVARKVPKPTVPKTPNEEAD